MQQILPPNQNFKATASAIVSIRTKWVGVEEALLLLLSILVHLSDASCQVMPLVELSK